MFSGLLVRDVAPGRGSPGQPDGDAPGVTHLRKGSR